jgi:hypothetical protein
MKFSFGQTVFTIGVSNACEKSYKFFVEVLEALNRYAKCDWGDLCSEDKQANEDALANGYRILAKYDTSEGPIYIITEWYRSVTTVLFTDEY